MLECIIFAIIENGEKKLFEKCQFGVALVHIYDRSRTCDKTAVSKAFRTFFHGTQADDRHAVMCGEGHGSGSGDTAPLQNCVLQVLGEVGFRFVSRTTEDKRGEVFVLDDLFTCGMCTKTMTNSRAKSALVALKNHDSVSLAVAAWLGKVRRTRQCEHCTSDMDHRGTIKQYPTTIVMESKWDDPEHSRSETFDLETSFQVLGVTYELISVCYHGEGHYTGDARRKDLDGLVKWFHIDDMKDTADRPGVRIEEDMSTARIREVESKNSRTMVLLAYLRRQETVALFNGSGGLTATVKAAAPEKEEGGDFEAEGDDTTTGAEEAEVVGQDVTMMEGDVTKHESMEPLSGEEANSGRDGTFGHNEEATVFQTTEAMEEVARALALIAGPRRDDQKAEGLEAGGQDDVMMTSQGTLMAESIAVDGSQQVRGADDVRVSNVQSVQGFGNRASNGSGAAEDVGTGAFADAKKVMETNMQHASEAIMIERPADWGTMSKTQRRNWYQRLQRTRKRNVEGT